MPYNEDAADKIRLFFSDKEIDWSEKLMFGGICFMIDEKMCTGLLFNKKAGEDYLMCRIGEQEAEAALEQPFCIPMTFSGRPMTGYVFITEEGFRSYKDLSYWLQLCLNFNPLAKKSKK